MWLAQKTIKRAIELVKAQEIKNQGAVNNLNVALEHIVNALKYDSAFDPGLYGRALDALRNQEEVNDV